MDEWESISQCEDIDIWEEQVAEEYEEYLSENCKCSEECECLTFEKFRQQTIDSAADRYEGMDEEDYKGAYA